MSLSGPVVKTIQNHLSFGPRVHRKYIFDSNLNHSQVRQTIRLLHKKNI